MNMVLQSNITYETTKMTASIYSMWQLQKPLFFLFRYIATSHFLHFVYLKLLQPRYLHRILFSSITDRSFFLFILNSAFKVIASFRSCRLHLTQTFSYFSMKLCLNNQFGLLVSRTENLTFSGEN